MSGLFDNIPNWLKGKIKLAALNSGLTPVYRIETSERLSSGTIGDKTIIDRFPAFIKIQEAEGGIAGLFRSMVSKISKAKIIAFLKGGNMQADVLGIMIDEGMSNYHRFITNVIFQDQKEYMPTGNQWLSSKFAKIGYPLRITMGFLTPEGHFKQHPYDDAIKLPKNIYPDYTGVIAAATRENMVQGDRFQITCVGFEYLLDQEQVDDQFEIHPTDRLDETLARVLLLYAIGDEVWDATKPLLRPIPILKAMGVVTPKTEKLRSLKQITKAIKFVDIKKNAEVIVTKTTLMEEKPKMDAAGNVEYSITLFDIIRTIQSKAVSGGLQIYFDFHGRLTVQGRNGIFTDEIVLKRTPNVSKRTRVHDCVLGSNSIHLESHTDLEGLSGQTNVFFTHLYPMSKEPEMIIADPHKKVLMQDMVKMKLGEVVSSSDEVAKYYGKHFGKHSDFWYEMAEERMAVGPFAQDFASTVAQRYKYYGMRGSAYMIGNPKIRVGDVLRVTDMKGNEGLGINIKAVLNISKEASDTVRNFIQSRFKKYDPSVLRTKDVKLAMGEIDGYYYVWKVRHYIGSDTFTSKAFFVKEPFSLL